ncbi:MAG: M48 family metallopeptidase, partial [Bacteroidales bacterium]|nr:M48 family metallopeptidase [Bacteroidales bacterium]
MILSRTLSAVALGASLLLAACATSPTGRSQIILVSDAEMAQMGAQAFDQLKKETPPTRNSSVSSYVNCVANAITPHVEGRYSWEVEVFEDDSVNAFALPGGKIGVNTGLLKAAQNQHQLAAVVGHEIAHVIARHSAARVSNQLATQMGVTAVAAGTGMDPQLIGMGADLLVTLPYSRGDETEADILGLDYMARAGFDPRESVALWQN